MASSSERPIHLFGSKPTRYQRRPIPVEPEPEKRIGVVDTKGNALSEVANFPVISPTEVAQTAQEREPEPENEWSGNIGKARTC